MGSLSQARADPLSPITAGKPQQRLSQTSPTSQNAARVANPPQLSSGRWGASRVLLRRNSRKSSQSSSSHGHHRIAIAVAIDSFRGCLGLGEHRPESDSDSLDSLDSTQDSSSRPPGLTRWDGGCPSPISDLEFIRRLDSQYRCTLPTSHTDTVTAIHHGQQSRRILALTASTAHRHGPLLTCGQTWLQSSLIAF